jgi:predicted transcriptional regulator
MEQLNTTELQIMKYLWKLETAFMKDIVEQFPEPKPAYTTISTLVSRMVNKKYIGFEKLGRDKHYFPILKKNNYFGSQLNGMIKNFFNDSSSQFASFFTDETELTNDQLKELQQIISNKIDQKN